MSHRSLPILTGIAGLSWFAAQSISPDMGANLNARLDSVAASPESQALSTALFAVAAIFFVISAIFMVRIPLHGRGSRLIRIGGVMLGIAGVWLAAGRAGYSLAMLQLTSEGVSREAAVTAISADPGIAFLGILPALPALILGPVALGFGVGLRHRRLQGWLPLSGWVVGIGIFVASEFISKIGEITGIAIAALALLLASLAVGRFGDELPGTVPAASGRVRAAGPSAE